jgi:flagellin-like protein
MNVKELFTDDSAVSPVIGVVLMVAITVLLAATAATFFLSIGQDNSNSTPQVATSFDYEADTAGSGPTYPDDSITVSHNSGDTVVAKNLDIVVSDARIFDDDNGDYSDLDERFQWDDFDGVSSDEDVSGGDAVTLQAGSEPLPAPDGLDLDGATVKLVWDDPSSSSTFTLNTWTD